VSLCLFVRLFVCIQSLVNTIQCVSICGTCICVFCLNCSLELHQSLILAASSPTVIDTQMPSQLALPAPSPEPPPPVTQTSAVSTRPVSLSTAPPQRALAFTPIHSQSVAQPASPYHIQLANQNVQASPVLSVVAYDTASGTFFDPRSGLATKIKGGMTLSSLGKTSNKFSPYWRHISRSVGLISLCDVFNSTCVSLLSSLCPCITGGCVKLQWYIGKRPRILLFCFNDNANRLIEIKQYKPTW